MYEALVINDYSYTTLTYQVVVTRLVRLARPHPVMDNAGGTIALHLPGPYEFAKWDKHFAKEGWKFMQSVTVACQGNTGIWNLNARSHAPARSDTFYIWQPNVEVANDKVEQRNTFMWLVRERRQDVLTKTKKMKEKKRQKKSSGAEGGEPDEEPAEESEAEDGGDGGKSKVERINLNKLWRQVHIMSDTAYLVGAKQRQIWEKVRERVQ
jgi:hypothetical protein